MRRVVRQEVADVLGLDVAEINPKIPLATLGMDSLMSLELRGCFERRFGLKLPATLLWTCPTVDALVEHFTPLDGDEQASAGRDENSPPQGGDVGEADRGAGPEPDLDALSDEEVARLLELELAALQA